MRANIEERLSEETITTRAQKSEKTTWVDIALGIYFGGLALSITISIISVISYNIYIERMKIEMEQELQEMLHHRQ